MIHNATSFVLALLLYRYRRVCQGLPIVDVSMCRIQEVSNPVVSTISWFKVEASKDGQRYEDGIQSTSRVRDELVLISLLRHAASVFHLARNGGEVGGWENGGGWPGAATIHPSSIARLCDATNK